jgi:ATP-dependent Lon protease
MKRCNLGLIGPPGVGKTSIARLLASVLDFPFEQISAGGTNNDSFLKGHSYTYVGSSPGELVKCLKRMGCKNGILFLDEYEKTAENTDVRNTMLQVTDPVQSHMFIDNFLGYPIDLSCLWQIYSMNSLPSDEALCDRIFAIDVEGYTYTDKLKIIQDFLLPKALKNVGLNSNCVVIDNPTASYLITKMCKNFDKGVRSIERGITDLVNKINFIAQNQDENGYMNGFNVSFQLKHKLTFPIVLTPVLIDKLAYHKELDDMVRMMYI